MKKTIFISILFLVIGKALHAQIGINTTTPDANAALDIKSGNKGILIPRTSTTTRLGIVNTTKGLMVYDTTTGSFWYHDGTAWNEMMLTKNGWNLNGNTGTTAANFIGTTDAQPLRFRVKNIPAGIIDSAAENVALGMDALSNTTGIRNVAIGNHSLPAPGNSNDNVSIGDSTMFYIYTYGATPASQNTAVGSKALINNVVGGNNTAVGFSALLGVSGGLNTGVGSQVMVKPSNGQYNTGVGAFSLSGNTGGNGNTAIGISALVQNTSGSYNAATGGDALFSNTTGMYNTVDGEEALYLNTIGSYNTAVGSSSLNRNTTGSHNTALGTEAMYNNLVSDNTAIGYEALYTNDNGTANVAIGSKTMYYGKGDANTAVGFNALEFNSGSDNVAIGNNALLKNSGDDNTATGSGALYNNSTGSENTASGYASLSQNTTGYSNTAFGYKSSADLMTGNSNCSFGINSLFFNSTGSGNTALGASADVTTGDLSFATAIGANAKVACSNCLVLGGTVSGSSQTFVGINNASPYYSLDITEITGRGIGLRHPGDNNGNIAWEIYHAPSPYSTAPSQAGDLTFWYNANLRGGIDNTSGAYSALSDERMKQDIAPMFSVLDKIKLLKPSTYHYITNTDREYLGFLAQDVEKVFPQLIHHINTAGKQKGMYDVLTMDYSGFSVVAIKAIQEQQQQIDELKTINTGQLKMLQEQKELLGKLQAQMNALLAAEKK